MRTSRIVAAVVAAVLGGSAAPVAGTPDPATNERSDDEHLEMQWALDRIYGVDAWQVATGRGIRIAIVGPGAYIRFSVQSGKVTSIDGVHEDLSCEIDGEPKLQWSVAPTNADDGKASNLTQPNYPPNDTDGPGTHLAGVIGACADNGIGVAGVAPETILLPYVARENQLPAAIERALAAGAHVIHLSAPPVARSPNSNQALADAVAEAAAAGAIVVAAAGDDAAPRCALSYIEEIVCVGATDNANRLAPYSAWPYAGDPGAGSDPASVGNAVVAPGGSFDPRVGTGAKSEFIQAGCTDYETSVIATYLPEKNGCMKAEVGRNYRVHDGTAVAAAHVAGVAALTYEAVGGQRSAAGRQDVIDAILSSAVHPFDLPHPDPMFGHGVVNALGAVEAADRAPTASPSPTESATPSPSPSPSGSPATSPSPSPSPIEAPPSGSPSPTGSATASPTTGTDPYRPDQWSLDTVRVDEARAAARDSEGRWKTEANGDKVTVAVLGSGLDGAHEDLQCDGKIAPGRNYVGGNTRADEDEVGDATHVAGIVGACSGNGRGIEGIAPGASVAPYRLMRNSRLDWQRQNLIQAIADATDDGAQVMFIAPRRFLPEPTDTTPGDYFGSLEKALEQAAARGVVMIAPAGDRHASICEYTSMSRHVICVGATDKEDRKAWYSSFAQKIEGPAVVAPGGLGQPQQLAGRLVSAFCDLHAENILSLLPQTADTCDEGRSGYASLSGTMQAAAHVAGLAAMLYGLLDGERNLANAQSVVQATLDGADDLPKESPNGYDPAFGFGRINALRSVEALHPKDFPDPIGHSFRIPVPLGFFEPARFQAFRPGRTTLASASGDGMPARLPAAFPDISADGRWIAFAAWDPLVPTDVNGWADVFVKDRLTGEVELVSLDSYGNQGNGCSHSPSISADGRYVAFVSDADNLVPDDTNGGVLTLFRCQRGDIFVHDRSTGTTTRVSVATDGTEQRGNDADSPSINADGTKIAFASTAKDLVEGVGGSGWQVYLHDVEAGTTVLLSKSDEGKPGSDWSFGPDISADGQRVAFFSWAHDLVPDDTNNVREIFVTHIEDATSRIERVSVSSDEEQANYLSSSPPSISADGRFVAFDSLASNLVPDDTNYPYPVNYSMDVFVRDLENGETERISVLSNGEEVKSWFTAPVISGNGRYVAFYVYRPAFPNENRNQFGETPFPILLHDRKTGTTELVSVDDEGREGNRSAGAFALSDDGRYAVFESLATNLTPDDADRRVDVFLRDRGPELGAGGYDRVEHTADGVEVEGWATFTGLSVAKATDAPDDAASVGSIQARDLGAELRGGEALYRPERNDLLIRWHLDHLPSTRYPKGVNGTLDDQENTSVQGSFAGRPGVVYGFEYQRDDTFSYQVRTTRFSAAKELADDDEPRRTRFGLFKCLGDACAKITTLTGGLGTTGEEVRVGLPLDIPDHPLQVGGSLLRPRLFTALGAPETAPALVDEVILADSEVPLPVPSVTLGAAPAGSHPDAVVFDVPVDLSDEPTTKGRFAGRLPRVPVGDHDVWTRACLWECDYFTLPRSVPDPPWVRLPRKDPPPPPPPPDAPPGEGDLGVVQPQPPISQLAAAPGTTKVVAGGSYGDGLPATRASLDRPSGAAVGPDGVYISDFFHHQVRRVAWDGTITTIAGRAGAFNLRHDAGTGDGGPAIRAYLNRPIGLAFDDEWNLYIADGGNHRIRRVDRETGIITTVAGNGSRGRSGDGGPATEASLALPYDVAVTSDGTIYIADYENWRVRKVHPETGIITTFAGTGDGVDGVVVDDVAADGSPVIYPSGLALDARENVYIADSGNCRIRKVDSSTNKISTVAGGGHVGSGDPAHSCGDSGDGGPATSAQLGNHLNVDVVDARQEGDAPTIYIADSDNQRVRVVDEHGVIDTRAGSGGAGCAKEAIAADQAKLHHPAATAVDSDGNLYVMVQSCERAYVVSPDGLLTPYAGNGTSDAGGDGDPATAINFGVGVSPYSFDDTGIRAVAYGPDGQPYFAELHKIWTVAPDGTARVVAGADPDRSVWCRDAKWRHEGRADSAWFGWIEAITFDDYGRLWVVDRCSEMIKVVTNGTVRIAAGNGRIGDQPEAVPGREGPAREVRLRFPRDLVVAPDGGVFFTEFGARGRIRVLKEGRIYTLGGAPANDDDYSGSFTPYGPTDGPITEARFQTPEGIDLGPDGSLYVTERYNNRIRRISGGPGGALFSLEETGDGPRLVSGARVSTIAGDGGNAQMRGDGSLAALASLPYPEDVVVDDEGNVFFTDTRNDTNDPAAYVVRQVSPTGMTTTVAGIPGISEPGLGGGSTSDPLVSPRELALSPSGMLLADGNTLRVIAPPLVGWPRPATRVVCDPFGSDRKGDVYSPGAADGGRGRVWLDVTSGNARSGEGEVSVTLDVEDLTEDALRMPLDSEGGSYMWAYIFSMTGRHLEDGNPWRGYIAAVSELDGVRYEYGTATRPRINVYELTPEGAAAGEWDMQADRVTLRVPFEAFELHQGDAISWQLYTAGVRTRWGNVFRSDDNAPDRWTDGTYRSHEIGRNCPEDYGAPAPPDEPRITYPLDPTDALFEAQWAPQKIRVPLAWQERQATGHGVKVAVIDSGVDAGHEDLACAGKLAPGVTITGGEVRPGAADGDGHGTHVAGIVGACTDNATGTAGVAPDAKILPYRVVDERGGIDFRDVGAAIRHATDAGAHVINLSLGPLVTAEGYGPDLWGERDTESVRYALSKGVVVVAAAGNDSFPLCSYPGWVDEVVCVGATDQRDHKAWYSSFPHKSNGLALVAPGGAAGTFCDLDSENVLSLWPSTRTCGGREGYASAAGTSQAAPHVAGVAALVYDRVGARRSPETRDQVLGALVSTARDLGQPGYDPAFGHGRVDALAAVRAVDPIPHAAQDPAPPPPSPPRPPAPPSPEPSATATPAPSASPSPSAEPTPEPGSVSTTVAARRAKVGFRRPIALRGRVSHEGSCPGTETVEISKRRFGTKRYRAIRTVEVGRRGSWSTTVRSKVSAAYIATPHAEGDCTAVASTPVSVKVRAKVVVKAVKRCPRSAIVKGVVRPNHKNTKVILQKRNNKGRWRKKDADRLNKRSRFRLEAPRCKGVYRVVWKGRQDPRSARGATKFRPRRR